MFRTRRHSLVAALLAALVALAVPSVASACPGAGEEPTAVSLDVSEDATFCLINRERTTRGLRALRRNKRLDLASRRHARSMAARDFFEHGNFVGRIRSARYLRGARAWRVGENIAWGSGVLGTPVEIVDAWMHSDGHRANILSRSFREIGIGIARGTPNRSYGDGGTYVTDFGSRG
ncbi:MAG TPA: CAP domain-containing protein [Thermoleophilaceae bacterium]|jgi:uncharacterized protein YkwD